MKRFLVRLAKRILRRPSGIKPMARGSLFGRCAASHIVNTSDV